MYKWMRKDKIYSLITKLPLMKVSFLVIFIVLIGIIFALLNIISLKSAHAQIPQEAFSGNGTILSSFPCKHESFSHTALKPATANTSAPSSSYKLDGTWMLDVNNNKVTNFKAMIIMSSVNRTNNNNNNNHTYEITNFHNGRNGYAQLYPNGVAFIVGTSDVKENGNIKWKGVNTAIIIDKLTVFKIVLDSNATGNLFNGQPIQGFTQSLKDSSGMSIVSGGRLSTAMVQQPLGTTNLPSQRGPLSSGQINQPSQENTSSTLGLPGQVPKQRN